jgi:hypothetical protein
MTIGYPSCKSQNDEVVSRDSVVAAIFLRASQLGKERTAAPNYLRGRQTC